MTAGGREAPIRRKNPARRRADARGGRLILASGWEPKFGLSVFWRKPG